MLLQIQPEIDSPVIHKVSPGCSVAAIPLLYLWHPPAIKRLLDDAHLPADSGNGYPQFSLSQCKHDLLRGEVRSFLEANTPFQSILAFRINPLTFGPVSEEQISTI
jgi:hypothetical protein